MTMKLSNEFKIIRDNFLAAINNNEPAEKQNELYGAMLDELLNEAKKQARAEAEGLIAANPADAKLSARERKFFNAVTTDVGYKEEKLLPQETIDRIFENLTTAHPLLAEIGMVNAGLRLKFLKSETSGVAVWGNIYGEIKGQLDAAFSEEEAIQNKLTAFVVIPKDLKDFGPAWIESFVSTQIDEAFAVALEAAFLAGDGNGKPIGLNRQVQAGVAITGGVYPEKTSIGDLTFADSATTVKELTNVYKHHSTDEKGRAVAVDGKVVMVVNPADAWDVKRQYTSLNAQGVYVTALPYNLKIVESLAQVSEKVVTFVSGRYDAYIGGGITLRKYDQTLAIEDMDLYTAKQFAYGKAKDDKAAAVWGLKVNETPVDPTPEG
ncbi:phage major capsid protein [Enterococcus faecium]|uniref:phage major capsid protein n=1 Tax=Enterococcus faecium TaxID=1352 RepID=UPI000C27366D|nr:phage major capsid protein [Enterococcus faecium]PJO83628.1 phage major capsid protein [Enterococcus faecium]RXA59655.1 phage major capsid protein [Enterococcus faecium]RXA82081.1 phage major capsid protein [Enterococcus faecium]TBV28537.1 phage major capsid protein [Enterococcus faecium]TBV29596.1 phage major capsid protein [Enterococcus faecium]